MKLKIMLEEKRVPENILTTKNEKQRRNSNKLNKRSNSTIKDDSKKLANESTRKERIKNYTKPSEDPT